MKCIYFDCSMGAAGDMLMAALVSLLPDEKRMNDFILDINSIGLENVTVTLTEDEKCGIKGKHVKVEYRGCEEVSVDENDESAIHTCDSSEFSHDKHHHNSGVSLEEIESIIRRLHVSEKVKEDVLAIYRIIAEAESRVHGEDVAVVHFHELGMMDAITDITGCAMLMELIGAERVVVSPVNVGHGMVRCAHGILSVPAPATTIILEGIPCYMGREEGELCTPTGAAILKYYGTEYTYMPKLTIAKTGYGTGNKDFETANVVKAIVGDDGICADGVGNVEKCDAGIYADGVGDECCIAELNCNLDDMTGEEIGYAVEILLGEGAKDVYTTPIFMKKNRPAIMLTVLCFVKDRERMTNLIFKHTTTLGIRERSVTRYILTREIISFESSFGVVRIKKSTGYGVTRCKAEYEDVARIAKNEGKSILEIYNIIEKEYSEWTD